MAVLNERAQRTGGDGTEDVVVGRIRAVGERLRAAIEAVTAEVPATSRSPQEFARVLKVHRTLAGRLLSAVRTDDPLAAVSRLPRGEGLRIFLSAARSSVSRATLDQAEAALLAFEALVDGELGGWDGFEAAITEWLPEARERFELANKQLAFKGLSNLLGARADVQLVTSIYYPDASGELCDIAIIEGLVGLRRLRPSARIPFATITPSPRGPRPLAYVLEDIQHTAGAPFPLLEDFCSQPLPQFEAVRNGDETVYYLAGSNIGAQSAVDIFAASVVRGGRPLYHSEPGPAPRPSGSAGANVPCGTLLLNVLLAEDVWPNTDAELLIYDTHMHGLANPNDRLRDIDRLDMAESVQMLGKGVARFRAADVGRHVEMVEYVCEQLGWDAARLRGYRVHVQYPLFNTQYCLAFSPTPPRPA